MTTFVGGFVFALGLGLSGMTDTGKVIGFLNLAGDWDPSLAFVMVGAIGVHLLLYRLILRRQSPIFGDRFHIPTRRDISPQLVGGAAVFGVGWGMSGFCPGVALVSLAGLGSAAGVFVLFMLGGMLLRNLLSERPSSAVESEGATC